MHVIASARDLQAALKIARKIASKLDYPYPCVMLTTEAGSLHIHAYSPDRQVTSVISAQINRSGKVLVPVRFLHATLYGIPKKRNTKVELKLQTAQGGSESLLVKVSNITAELRSFPKSTAYPPPLVPSPSKTLFSIEARAFVTAIMNVAFVAAVFNRTFIPSQVMDQPVLGCVRLRVSPNELSLMASNGLRLVRVTLPIHAPVLDKETDNHNHADYLIDAPYISQLATLLGSPDAIQVLTCTLSQQNGQLIFSLNNLQIVMPIYGGTDTYPELDRLIPTAWTTQVIIDRVACLKAANRVAGFDINSQHTPSGTGSPLMLRLDENCLGLEFRSHDLGDTAIQIAAETSGHNVTMWIGQIYLRDALHHIASPAVVIEATTPNKPLIVRPLGDHSYVVLLLPYGKQFFA